MSGAPTAMSPTWSPAQFVSRGSDKRANRLRQVIAKRMDHSRHRRPGGTAVAVTRLDHGPETEFMERGREDALSARLCGDLLAKCLADRVQSRLSPAIIRGAAAMPWRMRVQAAILPAGSSPPPANSANPRAQLPSGALNAGAPHPSRPCGCAIRSRPTIASIVPRMACCTGWVSAA